MPPSEGSVSWTVFVWSSGKTAGRGAWAAAGVAVGGGDGGTPRCTHRSTGRLWPLAKDRRGPGAGSSPGPLPACA